VVVVVVAVVVVVVVVGCGCGDGRGGTDGRGHSAVVDERVTLTKDKSCDKRVTGEGDKLPPPPTADVSSAGRCSALALR